jgi:hypothetical protein
MKRVLLITILAQLLMLGCRQQAVDFGTAESTAMDVSGFEIPEEPVNPVVPEDPITPVDPIGPDPVAFQKRVDDLTVDDRASQTDILFVIDNSSSMRYEQRQISQRFNNFIDQIDGLDWHIAITTTDWRSHKDWNDGKLHPFKRGMHYLTPSLGKEKAQELFAKNVRRRESGNDDEQGIRTTFRSIQRAVEGQSEADDILRGFYRTNANLAVVLVSDEDESGSGPFNTGSYLQRYVKNHWPQKAFQFNSIIVHTQECLRGPGQTMGEKYEKLSMQTNGIVGDICAEDYSQMLKDIGQGVAELTRSHELGCTPQDVNGDQVVDMEIHSSNGGVVPGYALDGSKVIFDQALDVGDYEFHYFCKK